MPTDSDDWPEMPDNVYRQVSYYGVCKTCAEQKRETTHVCTWTSCLTGGWWSHRDHPKDGHDADIGWQPEQAIDHHGHTYTLDR
jgi:hypothetical protein